MEFGDLMMTSPNNFETIDKSACLDTSELTDNNNDSSGEPKASNTETNAENSDNEINSVNKNSSDLKCSDSSLDLASSSTIGSADSDDRSESSSLTRTLVSAGSDRLDIQRRKLFFQGEGGKFIENFLTRIDKQKRKGLYLIQNGYR